MSIICSFGTAPEQLALGFKGVGTVKGSEDDVLSQFFSEDVRLVRGGELANGEFEFYVMVKQVSVAASFTDVEKVGLAVLNTCKHQASKGRSLDNLSLDSIILSALQQ